MKHIKLSALAAAVTLPLILLAGTAVEAATAHNLQTGARTKNANDSAMTARMKQMHRRHRAH